MNNIGSYLLRGCIDNARSQKIKNIILTILGIIIIVTNVRGVPWLLIIPSTILVAIILSYFFKHHPNRYKSISYALGRDEQEILRNDKAPQIETVNLKRYRFNNLNSLPALAYGLLVVLITVGVYNLLVFNRFFPITEGWWSVSAKYILDGKIPYRDFFLFLPPLYPLQMAGFHFLFGYDLIYLRILGISISLLTTGILYLIYSRLFPAYIAALVTIVSMFCRISLRPIISYDFNELVYLYLVIVTYLIIRYCDIYEASAETRSSNKRWIPHVYLLLIGLFCSFGLLTKQNSGVITVAAVIFVLFICEYKRATRSITKTFAFFLFGLFLPVAGISLWLYSNNAFYSFLDQTFLRLDTKGSLKDVFFLWIPRLVTLDSLKRLLYFFIMVIILFVGEYKNIYVCNIPEFDRKQFTGYIQKHLSVFAIILIISLLAVCLPFIHVNVLDIYKIKNNFYYKPIVIVSVFVSFTLWVFCLLKILLYRRTRNKHQEVPLEYFELLIITTMSNAGLVACGTSGAVSFHALMLTYGVSTGYLILKVQNYLWKGMLICSCLLLVTFFADNKYKLPYEWWGIEEPDVRTSTVPVSSNYLQGFVLNPQRSIMLSETIDIIGKNTLPGDTVFTFPNIPLFYLLANRYPTTFALVHWYDVTPRWVCERDATQLLKYPPKMIIMVNFKDMWNLKVHEKIFNNGMSLPQRQIWNILNEYTSDQRFYSLERSYDIAPGCQLEIFLRKSEKQPIV